MASEGKDVKTIYEALSQSDVRRAADEFRPVYHRTDGKGGTGEEGAGTRRHRQRESGLSRLQDTLPER